MRIRLEPGEHVVVRTRPHPRKLMGRFAATLFVLAATGYGLGWYSRAQLPPDLSDWEPALITVFLLAAALILTRIFLMPLLAWAGTRYILTNRRLIRRAGFTRRSEREVRLTGIFQIMVEQGLLERMSGGGTLVLDLGRDRFATFSNVPQVATFKEYMVSAIGDLPLTAMFDGVDMEAELYDGPEESVHGMDRGTEREW